MSDNLKIWNDLKQVPPHCLKPIAAGRLKGMSNVSPQWRLQAMTHQFGICGFGWKYVITNKWLEDASDNQKVAFVDVDLFINIDGKWSDAIQGTGGSSFIAKEKNGMYTSDEAYKMALTDALSVAMKCIGVASDVYLGNFDGSKYTYESASITNAPSEYITESQVADLDAKCQELNVDMAKFYKFFGITKTSEMKTSRLKEAINMIDLKAKK